MCLESATFKIPLQCFDFSGYNNPYISDMHSCVISSKVCAAIFQRGLSYTSKVSLRLSAGLSFSA